MTTDQIFAEILEACITPTTPRHLIIYAVHARRKDLGVRHITPDTDAGYQLMSKAMLSIYPDDTSAHQALAFLNRMTDNISRDIHTEHRTSLIYWLIFSLWAIALLFVTLISRTTTYTHIAPLGIIQTGGIIILLPLLRLWSRGRKVEYPLAIGLLLVCILFAMWLTWRGFTG